MGIRNFIAEFQDYFYVRRSIIERLDENSLSSSNIEVAYKQTEDIVEDFKTNLEFLDKETTEILKEIEDVIGSLDNKIEKINRYAEAIKDVNTSSDDIDRIVEIHPYEFDISSVNWEYNSRCYMLEPKSSYVVIKPYSTATDNISKKGLSKFLLDDTYSSNYIVINKEFNIDVNNIVYMNSSREELKVENLNSSLLSNRNIISIPQNTRYINVEFSYDTEPSFSITPLSFYHHPKAIISLENKEYKYGDIISFNKKSQIPFGCFAQIMLHCVFKDVNENVLKIQDVWYPIDNDGLIVIEKGRVTNEKVTRVWKDGAFKDVTDTSTISNDDYVLCKPTYGSAVKPNTESSFLLNVKNSKTITIQPTLYLYSLMNEALTPRLFSLTGIVKNEP